MAKTAGIIIIGNEILSGKFADENAQLLIKELRDLGVDLRRIVVIPDETAEIAATVRNYSRRFDLVFTSGGVGPTHDDVTIAGIAQAFETEVVVDPRLEKVIRDHWGEAMPPANLRLAELPAGAELVGEETGKGWPVVRFGNVYIFPGVPALFRYKFMTIRELFRSQRVAERRLYAVVEEGELADDLAAVADQFPGVAIGSYPRFGESEFKVIITLEASDQCAVDQAATALRQRMGERLLERQE